MKLLYCGSSACDEPTLKRLLIIGTELGFMDRPSVTFVGKWGTVGQQSIFRNVDTRGAPVTITVHAPPSGPAAGLYEPYAIADFDNPEFTRLFLEGLRYDNAFASKFIQTEADYGDGVKGKIILDSLARDANLTPLKSRRTVCVEKWPEAKPSVTRPITGRQNHPPRWGYFLSSARGSGAVNTRRPFGSYSPSN